MKTLLIIVSHAGEKDRLARHWDFFKKAGCDLCGSASDNKSEIWPEEIPMIHLGAECGRGGDALPRNFIRTWEGFLRDPAFSKYDQAAQIESDCIFFKPFPWSTKTITAHLAGGMYPGLKASNFYHPPWIVNRDFMPVLIEEGNKMIAEGDIENGYTDFVVGRFLDRTGNQITPIQGVYSRNTLEDLNDQEQVRQLASAGRLVMAHGVKTVEQLKAVIP